MSSADALLAAAKHRHSQYQLSNKSPISDARIREIVETTVLNVPSAFNTQSTRVLVLLKDEHERLWDIVSETLHAHVKDPEKWKQHTEPRMKGFRAAYATILFFEDPTALAPISSGSYADKAGQWSEHTNAYHQYLLWLALDAEGFGCNLQHYNPLIDEKVARQWGTPTEWQLRAQLVFGTPTGPPPGAKEKKPLEGRVLFAGL